MVSLAPKFWTPVGVSFLEHVALPECIWMYLAEECAEVFVLMFDGYRFDGRGDAFRSAYRWQDEHLVIEEG